MKKNLLFLIVLGTISLSFSKVSAAHTFSLESANPDTVGCNAPPPDSFRISGYGYGYVTLAWTPASPGDDHLITVYQEFNNSWDSIYSVYVEHSSAYTLTVPSPTTPYKFGIRTTCKNRTPSTIIGPIVGPTALIVDLTVEGRRPGQTQTPDCHNMLLPQSPSDWIGFEIYEANEGHIIDSTLFEFVPELNNSNFAGYVRRVEGPNDKKRLVAANWQSKWPTNNIPTIPSYLIFMVGKINEFNNLDKFGNVSIGFNSTNSVSICQDGSWANGFGFIPLIGSLTSELKQSATRNYQDTLLSNNMNIKVQNPCYDNINLMFDNQNFNFFSGEIWIESISQWFMKNHAAIAA